MKTAIWLQALAATSVLAAYPAFAGAPASHVFAKAVLQPTTGTEASGTVLFSQTEAGVEVTADVKGTTPGLHGFHVHEKGDCGDHGNAAGGHYNPTGTPHGAPNDPSSHVGDMGNIEIGADGTGHLQLVLIPASHPAFHNWADLIGRAVILHEKADDMTSQPSGNAGARIACGVIESVE